MAIKQYYRHYSQTRRHGGFNKHSWASISHTACVCGLLITFPDLTLTNTMRSRILFRLFGGFSVFHFAKFLSVRRQCGFLAGFRLTLNQEPTEVYILLRDTYTRVAFTWTQKILGLLEFQVPTHCRHCERVKIYGSFKCQ